ncbi:hypothetical protein W97_04623 [Coniosporium apollinis CBS 100218]|uniref:Uncharacterized protein n=1 Tax=Coniosporium apollinis (strain CBS 100218) TaxID=1168221 RepID=R7YU10_CONA1|nr:uncharacterized protein W97_04623 [Coniosporium apollinis CBS 100218]EON65385.1 hypothetical protein W97_04623 [Coniosporium apollinis CBS 100218]
MHIPKSHALVALSVFAVISEALPLDQRLQQRSNAPRQAKDYSVVNVDGSSSTETSAAAATTVVNTIIRTVIPYRDPNVFNKIHVERNKQFTVRTTSTFELVTYKSSRLRADVFVYGPGSLSNSHPLIFSHRHYDNNDYHDNFFNQRGHSAGVNSHSDFYSAAAHNIIL